MTHTSGSLKVRAVFNSGSAFSNHHPRKRPTKLAFFRALMEQIINGLDAGATQFNIVLSKKRHECHVTDNGRGFLEKDLRGFFQFYESEKADDETTTGQHGTGRTKPLIFSHEIQVVTVSRDCPNGAMASLTYEQLRKQWVGESGSDGNWTFGKLPKDWHMKKGEYGSLVRMIIDDKEWQYLPDPSVLINELAMMFNPAVAEMIFVNGKALKRRSIIGNIIRMRFTEKDLGPKMAKAFGGYAEIDLFLPEKKRAGECLRLCGNHPVCPISDFVSQVNDAPLCDLVPALIRRGIVLGDVIIPGLNKHVGEDRQSFKDSLLQSNAHVMIIQFLAEIVGPIIDQEFALKEAQDAAAVRAETLGRVVEEFNRATAFDPSKLPPDLRGKGTLPSGQKRSNSTKIDVVSADIVVDHLRARVPLNDTLTIEVLSVSDGIDKNKLVWLEGDQELGKGKSFVYVMSALGSHRLTVRNPKNHSQSTTICLEGITGHIPIISPGDASIERGGKEQAFRLRNDNLTSGKIKWVVTNSRGIKPNGIKLQNPTGLQTLVRATKECTLGMYTIRAVDKESEKVAAETSFEVKQSLPPNVIQIGETLYEVHAAESLQAQVVELSQNAVTSKTGSRGMITVNFDHQDVRSFQKADDSEAGLRFLLHEYFIIAHCTEEALGGRLETPGEWSDEVARLRSSVLKVQGKGSEE